jgi:magnesium transporter
MSQPEDSNPGLDESNARPVTVTVIDYDATHFSEWKCSRPEEIRLPSSRRTVTWIIVDGVHDPEIVEAIGTALGIHPLTREDIMNTRQRPKIEEYEDYLYVAVRAVAVDGDEGFQSRQVSLLLGNGYIVSFQEQPDGTFDRILGRLRAGGGRVRSVGPDYLFYALLDAIVDGYFGVIEVFGERIEVIEEEVMAEPDRQTLQKIYSLKRSLIALRRSAWPLRDIVAQLERGESPLISDALHIYFRDIYDHAVGVAETVETYRDMMSGILDIYLSSQSSRMNEIMKVLTIIATIFIPLTFIAGIYGMNFEYMPELSHPLGYQASLISMMVVAATMLIYFRRKGWI